MLIKIIEVNYEKKKFTGKYGNKDIFGYWIKFLWGSVEGYAYYFPPVNEDNVILNKITSVETAQKHIRDLKILDNEKNLKSSIKIINNFGDYIFVGIVENVCRDDFNEYFVADIKVDDCFICITVEDTFGCDLVVGDFVEFILEELSLYDEGIY